MTGTVRVEDAAVRIIGDAGDYSNLGSQLTHAQFELLQHPGRGEADSGHDGKAERVRAHAMSAIRPALRAYRTGSCERKSITLDTKTLRGVGRHTVVVFKDVPMLYLPWISFPLSRRAPVRIPVPDARQFLTQRREFSIPCYWNIAPNQDLTATPTLYTRRGIDLGAEYRLLERNGQGTARINYLPSDQLANTNRSWQRLDAIDELTDQLACCWSTCRTSATRITSRTSATGRWPAARCSCRATCA